MSDPSTAEKMMAAEADDEQIEERIETPEPKHLISLERDDIVLARLKEKKVFLCVTEEGEWSGGEKSISVRVYTAMRGGEKQYARLVYDGDRGEKLVVDVTGGGCEDVESLEVIGDEW